MKAMVDTGIAPKIRLDAAERDLEDTKDQVILEGAASDDEIVGVSPAPPGSPKSVDGKNPETDRKRYRAADGHDSDGDRVAKPGIRSRIG